MKQIILSSICLLLFFEINAQNKINKEIIQFVTKQNDTVSIYSGDIKIMDDLSFRLTDSNKLNKLREAKLENIYFIFDTGKKSRIWFQGLLSSSIPEGELYLYSLGNKVQIEKDSTVSCSKELLQKIKSFALPD
ncbi:hypothetical protein [Paraflavitalea speifideaquila]|uniref:hypothetical protein n=1 Tax=Paraflavitalea speifideaquila TaxID=3076558 RepID=UPI0028E6080E|nr:hypothetical protein [Paraflavitalea speifideiaquila]